MTGGFDMVIARIYNGHATIKGCYDDDTGPVSLDNEGLLSYVLEIVDMLRGMDVPVVVWHHVATTAVINAE
jgi:hypothetical protein